MTQEVKNPQVMQETQVSSLGQEDPLEKGMATHSSILAWRIPWIESMVDCSPWGHKESDMTEYTHSEKEGFYKSLETLFYFALFSAFISLY